jgi:hypothetical protein
MRYDIYDTTFSYGIPIEAGVDEETVMMRQLADGTLIVVNAGEKCPPFNPDLAEIYADIKHRLRQANKQTTCRWTFEQIKEKIRNKNEHTK